MAISDGQKIDYLFKKIGFGITKTDTNSNKVAANESIASPLLLRGDKVIKDAASIPSTKPGSSSGVVTVYTGATTVECTADITASANRTWKTGLTDWIPPEFGSTYLVNVYIHTSGDASNAESISNKVFITGSGNDDEWFFDYQSGVLHFIGTNLPNGVNFTGKSVYVAGARYTGDFGVGGSTGAFSFTDNRLQTTTTNEEIIIEPAGTGYVAIDSTSGLIIPVGTTDERPTGQTGMFRFNSTDGQVEVYNGTGWTGVLGSTESVTLDEFDGDGSTVAFTLSRTGTSASVWVSINGTVQEVTNTYTVSGSTLTFNEAPASGDKIQVRNFFSANTTVVRTSSIQDADGDTKIQVEESADEDTIRFDTGGTERLTISSSGVNATGNFTYVPRLTYWHLSADHTASTGVIDNWVKQTSGVYYNDTGITYSSGTFTFTEAGIYRISTKLELNGGGYATWEFRKNTTSYGKPNLITQVGRGYDSGTMPYKSMVMQVNQNDTFDINITASTGGGEYIESDYSELEFEKIG